jgi:hypothetical protein
MSRRVYIDPYYQYYQLLGNYTTMAPFISRTGLQQSVTGEGATINTMSYHTKIYSTDTSLNMTLADGRQEGQVKLITFTHKGAPESDIRVRTTQLMGSNSQITFSEVGDQVQIMWANGTWFPMMTLNTCDPSSQTPRIE